MSFVAGSILVKMEGDVKDLAKASKEGRNEIASVGSTAEGQKKGFDSMEKAGSLAFAGLGIAGAAVITVLSAIGIEAFKAFDEVETSQRKLAAQLSLTTDEAQQMGDVVKSVYKNNFGQSISEVSDAVFKVKQSLRELTDEQVQFVTESAFAIQDAYGQPIEKTTDAIDAMMINFGVSAETATNMIANGFQVGLNSSDDFLDTISEYSISFGEGGATADQFFNILASGSSNGVLGTDKVADSFKEFMIRLRDGSKGTRAAFDTLGIGYDETMQKLADGTVTGADLFEDLKTGVIGIGDTVTQQEAGVALFGTMFEDLGVKAFSAIDSTSDVWSDNTTAIKEVQGQYGSFGDIIEGVKRNVIISVSEGFKPLEEALTGTFNTLVANPDVMYSLAAGLGAVAAVLLFALTPSLAAAAGAAWALMAPLMPFVAMAIGIGAAVAGLAYLWNTNFLGIKDITLELWDTLMGFLQPALDTLKLAWDNLMNALTPVLTMLRDSLIPVFAKLWDFLSVAILPVLALVTFAIFGPMLMAFGLLVGGIYLVAGVFNWLATVIRNNMDKIKSFIDGGVDIFNRFVNKAIDVKNKVVDAFNGIQSGVGSVLKTVVNGIIDNVNNAIRAVNGVTSGLAVVPGAPQIGRIPEIPKFSRGVRNFEGGLATINENGIKEALSIGDTVYLPTGTDVFDGEETDNMIASMAGNKSGEIKVKVDGLLGTARDARIFVERLRKPLKELIDES